MAFNGLQGPWQQPQLPEASRQLVDAVDFESFEPDLAGGPDVDGRIVEEENPFGWSAQIGDHMFEDLPIRIDGADLVRKVELLHQRLHRAAMEWCVANVPGTALPTQAALGAVTAASEEARVDEFGKAVPGTFIPLFLEHHACARGIDPEYAFTE